MNTHRLLSAALGLALAAAASAAEPPLLLELFTSESCSSCPPADDYLGTLAQRADLLPLSFHVDYWNDTGWVDQFSTPAYTQRQRDYAGQLGAQVYTPQLVINGRDEVVGSDRRAAETTIAAMRAQRGPQLEVQIARDAGRVRFDVMGTQTDVAAPHLLLISFDPLATDAIHSGENGGRTISYHNLVRSLRDLGPWTGGTLHRSETLRREETGQRLALLVQAPPGGRQGGKVYGLAATP